MGIGSDTNVKDFQSSYNMNKVHNRKVMVLSILFILCYYFNKGSPLSVILFLLAIFYKASFLQHIHNKHNLIKFDNVFLHIIYFIFPNLFLCLEKVIKSLGKAKASLRFLTAIFYLI